MMGRRWQKILERYGQRAVLRRGEEETALQALIQPIRERREEQEVHAPLGLERRDRFLYLGPARHPLDLNTVVTWRGQDYRVQSAHLAGEKICPHWRAVLYPRDEVEL